MYISKQLIEKERQNIYNKYIFPINWFKYRKYIRNIKYNNKKYLAMNINNQVFDNVLGYSLDENQKKIILQDEDSLVVAGAGTGKTLTIIGKILYLVKCGVRPNEILCISLTNEACRNINNRCKKQNININALTFHKLSLNILNENNIKYNVVDEKKLKKYIHECTYNNIKTINLNINKTFMSFDIKGKLKKDKDLHEIQKEIYFNSQLYAIVKNKIFKFITLFKSQNMKINDFDKFIKDTTTELNLSQRKENVNFLKLVKEIYIKYSDEMLINNNIDFNDMINLALNTLKFDSAYIRNYKYIIVDEYQDISLTKCELLKEIKRKTGAKIMAVGDDYQSIYKFSGSSLKAFLNFKDYFPYSTMFILNKTYRNSQNLLDITGNFIMRNPYQIKKKLISNITNTNPINIYYYENEISEVLDKAIYDIKKGNIMILGRNNKDLENIKVSNPNIKCLTIHKSKGLESDNVIIVNLVDNINGFPSKSHLDNVFKYVTDVQEEYPYAEERRLFYVALTRTKNSNYLLVNRSKPSIFVEELLESKKVKIRSNVNYCDKCHEVLFYELKEKELYYRCKKCQKSKKLC